MALKNRIIAEIKKSCSYSHWFNGPVKAGSLLKKYGEICEYSIRPKEWKVYIYNSIVYIYWACQETPTKLAFEMLHEAVENAKPDLGDIVAIKVEDRWGNEKEVRTYEW